MKHYKVVSPFWEKIEELEAMLNTNAQEGYRLLEINGVMVMEKDI
jgi:hypothetical protein